MSATFWMENAALISLSTNLDKIEDVLREDALVLGFVLYFALDSSESHYSALEDVSEESCCH